MGLYEYLILIIRSLLWPPKGIILFEEQVLQWGYATLKVYLQFHMPNIICVIAIYMIAMFVLFERMPNITHTAHHLVRHIISFIFRLLFVVFFSWGMLIFGAVAGRLRGEEVERDSRAVQNVNINVYRSRWITITQSFTRLSWHFRLGRWLFRVAYLLLGHIEFIRRNPTVHRFFARGIALFVCVYGAWEIPYLLTH